VRINRGRVWLGGLAGGVVWVIWSLLDGKFIITDARYLAAQNAGQFLKVPRYSLFVGLWIAMTFVLAIIISHLYVWARATLGPGPKTAAKIGFLVGFASGFPGNFGLAAWSPIDRMFPLGWMLDMWVGSILAALVAGWVYRE
jgi:hypothetical protein